MHETKTLFTGDPVVMSVQQVAGRDDMALLSGLDVKIWRDQRINA